MSILLTYLLVATATRCTRCRHRGSGPRNEGDPPRTSSAPAHPVMGDHGTSSSISRSWRRVPQALPSRRSCPRPGPSSAWSHKALPPRFAAIHPRFLTPSYATVVAGAFAAAFYSILTIVSARVLTDTIYSLGIMICFYYGLTAFRASGTSATNCSPASRISCSLPFPLVGGLGLFGVLGVTLHDAASPGIRQRAQVSSGSAWC